MSLSKSLIVLVRPQKMRYDARRSLTQTRKMKAVLTGFFSLILAAVLFAGTQLAAVTVSRHSTFYAVSHDSLAGLANFSAIGQSNFTEKQSLAQVSTFNKEQLQAVVDAWRTRSRGTGSVVLIDADTGEQLAASNESQEYFTASIYKLYVAYVALQAIDAGVYNFSDPFIAGQTWQQCLDNMIRNSDSTCAEVMMAKITKPVIQQKLNELGFKGTNLAKLTTTAADAAFITQKIAVGEGLSAQSTELLHTAMHLQVYRDGLQKGFAGLDVYDKVGFYEVGWHDSAFIKLPNGKTVVVVVLTQDMGTRQVNDLAKRLQPLLNV